MWDVITIIFLPFLLLYEVIREIVTGEFEFYHEDYCQGKYGGIYNIIPFFGPIVLLVFRKVLRKPKKIWVLILLSYISVYLIYYLVVYILEVSAPIPSDDIICW